jgi:RNA polymerase sigma factor (sigma-70 family)
LRAWDRFDSRRAAAGTWLVAIARNLLVDHYRSRPSNPGEVPIDDVNLSELPSTSPEPRGLGLEPKLEQALAALSEREREVLALRFGAELTGPEIADVMGLSLANVQQIVSRSLRRLRSDLEQ